MRMAGSQLQLLLVMLVFSGVVWAQGCPSTCETARNRTPWSKLRSDLFYNGHDVTEIPSIGDGIPLLVTVHQTLQSVKGVYEKEQSVVGASTITVVWEDDRLTWMPSNHSNLTVLTLPYRLVWTPSLNLINTDFADSRIPTDPDDMKVHIKNDGQVTLETSLIHSTNCRMNLALFPFDSQSCHLFIASQDIANTVLLVPGVFKYRVGDRNPGWNVVSIVGESRPRVDQAGDHEVSDLVVTLDLQRLPLHYVLTIIVPVVLINVVGIWSFFIPLKSGERASTCISVVLGVTIFQIVISDVMPQTSRYDSHPYTVKYMTLSFVTLVGIMLSSVVALNISYRKGSIKRKIWRIFFFRILATLVFKRQEGLKKMAKRKVAAVTNDDKDSVRTNSSCNCEENHNRLDNTPLEAGKLEEQVSEDTDMKLVATILDRIFFFIFLMVELWMITLLGSMFSLISEYE